MEKITQPVNQVEKIQKIIKEINGESEPCDVATLFQVALILGKHGYINDPLGVNEVKCEMINDSVIYVNAYDGYNDHEYSYVIFFDGTPNPDVYILSVDKVQ